MIARDCAGRGRIYRTVFVGYPGLSEAHGKDKNIQRAKHLVDGAQMEFSHLQNLLLAV
ncbi:hypothetical protein D3C87_2051260 [compost metagenome]